MNNLKIATRLMLLISVLAALLMAIGLTGLPGISQSNAALKSVYEDRTIPMRQLGDVQHQLLLNRLAIANSVLDPTPETLARSIADVGTNLAAMQKTWDAYTATTLTDAATRYATVIPAPTRQRASAYQRLNFKGVPA